jgi:hypothetical protein
MIGRAFGFGGGAARTVFISCPDDFGMLSTSQTRFDLAHGPNQGYVANIGDL